MKKFSIFAVFAVLLPIPACAQVVINEVMYNPQGSDSGREWVELYNQGQSDVTMVAGSGKGSWRISDGSNHTLIDPASGTGRGSLTIPAGSYLVVANDPTDFTSGEYIGGAYSVVKSSISLSNNGTTISLIDGAGATVDSVAYSPTQGGNDDSSSLQRQSDGSWIAALPTPGAANSNVPYVAPVSNTSNAAQPSTQSVASSTDQSTGQPETPSTSDSYVAPPVPSVYASAGADRTVIVGADVEFGASAYDKTQTLLDPSTVRFMWNFGDGGSAEGESVLHHFSYPGHYAVVLDIADNKNAAMSQLTVDAQPAQLSLSLHSDGGIDIGNLSGHDLDLSDWIVREDSSQSAGQFILAQNSKILAGASMQISPQTLSFRASSSSMLEYPNGVRALTIGENSALSSAAQQEPQQTPSTIVAPVITNIPKTTAPTSAGSSNSAESTTPADDQAQDETTSDTDPVDLVASSSVLTAASADSSSTPNYLWWLGIGAFALAAAAALAVANHFKSGEWGIIEDGSE